MKKYIKSTNKGFSLIETIILIGVTAILSAMVTPDIVSFFRFYQERAEEEVLFEIKEGLSEYAKAWGVLPDELFWANSLSGFVDGNGETHVYVDLPVDQIQFDTWGRERQYRKFTYDYLDANGEEFRGRDISADYAMVMSYGPDRAVDPDTILTDVTGLLTALEPLVLEGDLLNFPVDQADAQAIYRALNVAGDDKLVVYNNLPVIVNNMEVLKNRIAGIKTAIKNYEAFMEDSFPIVINPPFLYKILYRPPARRPQIGGATPQDFSGNYHVEVRNEVDLYINGGAALPANQRFETTTDNDNDRLDGMTGLVRFIGLTDGFCCNPLIRYDDDGDPTTPTLEMPFYYYSNPREVVLGACNAVRPRNTTIDEEYLPIRIMTTPNELIGDDNNCG